MIGGAISHEELPARLIHSGPGKLADDEIESLWEVFVHIGRTWGESKDDPGYQRSQWLEFVHVKTEREPSYLGEYRNALRVLAELREAQQEGMWDKLFFEHGAGDKPTTRLGHLRTFVVEEFIKVWLTSGGFKTYGAGNYNSYISGSRFAVRGASTLPLHPAGPSGSQATNKFACPGGLMWNTKQSLSALA